MVYVTESPPPGFGESTIVGGLGVGDDGCMFNFSSERGSESDPDKNDETLHHSSI